MTASIQPCGGSSRQLCHQCWLVVTFSAVMGSGAPEFIPTTVIDDNTLEVIGQTDTAEAAVKMARSLGVSTERITWLEFENARKQRGIIG